MTDAEGDELRALRQRAYGPTADIHSDPKAVERLRQLEEGGSMSAAAATIAPDVETSRIESSARDDDTEELSSTSNHVSSPLARWRRLQFRPRRGSVLIVLAAAWLTAALIVALTLVQRVQIDPLQVGATQVKRLSVDTGFDAPTAFRNGAAGELRAYQDFYGARAVVQESSDAGFRGECMTIYQPELLTESNGGYSYSGTLFQQACAAGAFPAAVSLTVLSEFPQSLKNEYPEGTALQFVYDRVNNEVVVFRG